MKLDMPLLTVAHAAEATNLTRRALYKRIASGSVMAWTIDGVLFVPTSEIERLRLERGLLVSVDPVRATLDGASTPGLNRDNLNKIS